MSRVIKTAIFAFVLSCPCAFAFNVLRSYDFTTAGNTQGWVPTQTTLTVAGGIMAGVHTGSDPQFAYDLPDFSGHSSNGVMMRYRASTNGNVQLFWGIIGADGYAGSRVISASYTGAGEWQTILLSPRGHVGWDEKKITRLRIDPTGSTGGTFEIDWLRVLAWDYDNDGWRDDLDGFGDSDGDGIANMEDLDSNNDGISDEWDKAIFNAPGSVHFNFDTNNMAEGWAVNGDLAALSVTGGLLSTQVIGGDPQISRGRLHLQGSMIDGLIFRVASPSSGSFTLFWTHDAGTTFNATRSMTVSVPASVSGASRSVYFDMRAAAEWRGKLVTGLRLDTDFPLNTAFSFDYIRTSDGDYDRDGLTDTSEGASDVDGDGLPNYQDPDSDGDGVSDTEETRRGWNPYSAVEATRDSDGDGISDAAESRAGTDPYSAADRPLLFIQPNGQNLDLSFGARPGRSYGLESSDNLLQWETEAVVPPVTGSPTLAWSLPPEAQPTRKFFRIGVSGPMETPDPAGGTTPADEVGGTESAFLDNGTLRLGAPVNNGMSFNYLSPSGGGNLVNYHDRGRLIQQSYYAGANLDRRADGQSGSWSPWPWNPIQGGDASGVPAHVLELGKAEFGNGFFTRTIPLLWDMTTAEKGKSWMDQWNQFEPGMPNVIRVTCRFISLRDPDDIWGGAVPRHQELPAVYLIRSLSKTVTYQGASPWTNAPTEEVQTYFPGESFPWGRYNPSEGWVAMVNPTTNVGVGLFSPIGTTLWNVGATTSTPVGGPTDGATMHMAPIRTMRLDRDSILVYRYWIIYGDLTTIRSRVYELNQLYPGG